VKKVAPSECRQNGEPRHQCCRRRGLALLSPQGRELSSTASATWRMPGVFAGACRLPPLSRRRVEFDQLESSVAVRGLQERNLCPDAVDVLDGKDANALKRCATTPGSWRKRLGGRRSVCCPSVLSLAPEGRSATTT
jgi:hypothetical protein